MAGIISASMATVAFDRLPVIGAYARLRAQARQLETMAVEIERLRAQAAEIADVRRALEKRDRLVEELTGAVVATKALRRIVKNEAQHYREASPFPHLVIEDFLDGGILRRVAREFSSADRSGWHRTATERERKVSTEDETAFGPFTRQVFTALNSSGFLTFLEDLTGITGLIADPHLRGGGLHEIEPGGLLGVHADFNLYKRLKVWRRLNLLIYLNTDWDETWGGHLELWDRDGNSCVKRIAPTFNRAVIFDTSNRSYHGHPHPLACPEGQSRKSLALYYYTVDYPYTDDQAPHSTVFIAPVAS
jgi:2-oxoglutarate-Fe(II)-dependent oxygenase superfamily protein